MNFDQLLNLYHEKSKDFLVWKKYKETPVSTEEIRNALRNYLNNELKNHPIPSALKIPKEDADEDIKDMMAWLKNSVCVDPGYYKELYGFKNYNANSDEKFKDLINFAKVISLYTKDPNYHKNLIDEPRLQNEDIEGEDLWTIPHVDLCLVKNANPGELIKVDGKPIKVNVGGKEQDDTVKKFDLFSYKDLVEDLKQTGGFKNYCSRQAINAEATILKNDKYAPFFTDTNKKPYCGIMTQSMFFAFKNFVETVYDPHDAAKDIDKHYWRNKGRIDRKAKAMESLTSFLKSLPEKDWNLLGTMTVMGESFKDQYHKADNTCLSQFAGAVTGLLYQIDPTIQFANQKANTFLAEQGFRFNGVVEITNKTDEDKDYIMNLMKVISNTEFNVSRGSKITLEDGSKKRVPTHVAEIYNICQKAQSEEDFTEARYKAVVIAAECSRNAHMYRAGSTQNFYTLISDKRGIPIMQENESLTEHKAFTNGLKDYKVRENDEEFVRDLIKVISNTEFGGWMGTQITLEDGTQKNVPAHVAKIYNICQKALESEGDFSEARYDAEVIAFKCAFKPLVSNSAQNFYKLITDENSASILKNNTDLTDIIKCSSKEFNNYKDKLAEVTQKAEKNMEVENKGALGPSG
jgi:hypothetical protein